MNKQQIITFDNLMSKVSTYIKDEKEINMIKKAYELASKVHFGTYRMTGEAYIDHPINVAYILTDINADYETICAGLLHDVIEDSDVTKEELKSSFGNTIADLVDGVTKINKLNFESSGSRASIATQRKILVGLCNDVRVIFIKLADRLHNMRTLYVHKEETQKEKAKETLEILIPIAHRLGMNKWKSELEDLCLRYSKPDVYFGIVEQLNQSKLERDKVVNEMMDRVSKLLRENNIPFEIKGRAKSIYSIYKKLDKGKKFSDIYDLLALRVFVNTEQECYQALGIIHSKYRPLPKRFKDYIAMPKTNMYQSLHTTVFGFDGYLFEIQIRTYEMDEVAERGIASHWSYKENGGSGKIARMDAMEEKLQFFRSIMELNEEEASDEAFVKSITEEFQDTIYVFTPNGDVIELPNGATPIDFAYRVHSKVGEQMVGAIVNGVIVPLDYKLKSNDIVKINTNKNSAGPSREWIQMAKTTGAKNKIKAFFNKIDKEEYQKRGEEMLAKELRKQKITFSDFLSEENTNKILNEYKYNNLDELYMNIGNNRLSVISVIRLINGDLEKQKEELILRKTQTKNIELTELKDDIIVSGIDDIKVNVASCCKPVPGDPIVGYISKGYGINIHRAVCPNVKEVEERTISVHWNSKTEKKYPSTILIRTEKADNILLNIITKTSNNGMLVKSVNTYMHHNDVTYNMTVMTPSLEDLKKFILDIESLPSVYEVERVIQ